MPAQKRHKPVPPAPAPEVPRPPKRSPEPLPWLVELRSRFVAAGLINPAPEDADDAEA